jgi:hypothetical protein
VDGRAEGGITERKPEPKVDYTALYGTFIDKVSAPNCYVMPTFLKTRPIAGEIAVEPYDANDLGRRPCGRDMKC